MGKAKGKAKGKAAKKPRAPRKMPPPCSGPTFVDKTPVERKAVVDRARNLMVRCLARRGAARSLWGGRARSLGRDVVRGAEWTRPDLRETLNPACLQAGNPNLKLIAFTPFRAGSTTAECVHYLLADPTAGHAHTHFCLSCPTLEEPIMSQNAYDMHAGGSGQGRFNRLSSVVHNADAFFQLDKEYKPNFEAVKWPPPKGRPACCSCCMVVGL